MRTLRILAVSAALSVGGCAAFDSMTDEQREAAAQGVENTGGVVSTVATGILPPPWNLLAAAAAGALATYGAKKIRDRKKPV